MTEAHGENSCETCDSHDGTYCQNMCSDHYGHALAEFHPACDSYNAYVQEPELCKDCKMDYVVDPEHHDRCPDCHAKYQAKHPWLS